MSVRTRIVRTRVKFCAMTRVDDALAAVALGVDAIGMVMTRRSKRFVDIPRAREIRAALPPFVTAVTLFMDDEPGWIADVISAVQPDVLQFHGAETAAECMRYRCRYVKAVAMGDGPNAGTRVGAMIEAHPQASGFLLDGHAQGEQGGSGKSFDWTRFPAGLQRPLILAGGLTCDNVASAIHTAHPFAVDVASGIESAPGIKDPEKMRRFVAEVARANGEIGSGSKP